MEKRKSNGQRVILFPLPLQGCINPMIQLAKILHSKGFSITVIHTNFNAPKASNHPLFTFLEIQDGLSETDKRDVTTTLTLLNQRCVSPFRDCLTKLLESKDYETGEPKQRISCLIVDFGWFFTLPISKSFNLPSLAFVAPNVSFFRGHFAIPQLRQEGYLSLQDSEQDDPAKGFPPLRKKDVSRLLKQEPTILDAYLNKIYETIKASSGLIFMSCQELLDQDSLTRTHQEFQVPIFAIGPYHTDFPALSSSLLTPDETCIPWLDKQEEKSVIYVSFGSLVNITETELLEIASGLSNSDQPFLFVVRDGSVKGETKWIEAIPEDLMERLKEKGKIVKWAPQQEVLKHRAIGGYLTHNGWNSTVESICEGVPMICLPFIWDQMVNARFVSEIWMVGLHLENGIVRDEIERAIRRLLMGDEGEAIRERMKVLKERVERSIRENGLAYQALEDLVDG